MVNTIARLEKERKMLEKQRLQSQASFNTFKKIYEENFGPIPASFLDEMDFNLQSMEEFTTKNDLPVSPSCAPSSSSSSGSYELPFPDSDYSLLSDVISYTLGNEFVL